MWLSYSDSTSDELLISRGSSSTLYIVSCSESSSMSTGSSLFGSLSVLSDSLSVEDASSTPTSTSQILISLHCSRLFASIASFLISFSLCLVGSSSLCIIREDYCYITEFFIELFNIGTSHFDAQ